MERGIEPVSTSFEPGAPTPEGFIPLCVPEIRGSEWAYVKDCLDKGWVSSVGAFVDRFERMTADYVGTQYAVATSTGTAALHLALMAARVEPDEEVLVSALTFAAPVNAIHYVAAHPVFMDADARTYEMDANKVVDFLTQACDWRNGALINRATGRRVRAIMPVHILGHPVNIDPILEVAARFDLTVIEDATESLGARYKGRMVGHLGHIACLSYNGNKLITTGGGGMVITDDAALAKRTKYLSTQAKDDPVEYIHEEVGYNYRLTNVQAAIGCAQMEQIDAYIAKKREIAARYSAAFAEQPGLTPMPQADWADSVFWMYTVLIDEARYGMSSRALMRELQQRGIQSRPLWHPVHSLTPYKHELAYHVETADTLYRDALSLPCSVGLTDEQQTRVIHALQELAQVTA
jgi:perosamine synthetase